MQRDFHLITTVCITQLEGKSNIWKERKINIWKESVTSGKNKQERKSNIWKERLTYGKKG